MNINVIYPPQLPSLSTLKGNDQVIGYSPEINKTVRFSVATLRAGFGVPIWDPEEAEDPGYPADFIVEWQLKFWKSLVDENHDIPTEGASWQEVSEAPEYAINKINGGTVV